jgi:hypothetical protein
MAVRLDDETLGNIRSLLAGYNVALQENALFNINLGCSIDKELALIEQTLSAIEKAEADAKESLARISRTLSRYRTINLVVTVPA